MSNQETAELKEVEVAASAAVDAVNDDVKDAADNESFALAGDAELEDAEKPLAYLDGDADLHNALKQIKLAVAAGRKELEPNVNYIEGLLQADINLRTRVVGAVDHCGQLIDSVLAAGTVVNLANEDKQVHIPAGMQLSPQALVDQVTKSLEAYAAEAAPDSDMADVLKAIISPLSHRAILGEIALLKLRMWYALNVQFLPGRTAAHVSEIVADSESVTNGTFPAYMARTLGYAEPEWNFDLIPATEKLMDLDARHMYIHADGRELAVVVCNFMEVMQTHQGIAPAYDHSTLQLITKDRTLVPSRAVGCWRLATEEEIASEDFKVQFELYMQMRTAYEGTVVQMNAQIEAEKKRAEQATNARAAGLILPSTAQNDAPSLILPG